MRRAAAGLGALVLAGALTLGPAGASTTYESAVKVSFVIPVTVVAHIGTNYEPSQTSFIAESGTYIQKTGSGTCTTTTSDTEGNYTLSFGTITISSAGPTACNYQNAIGIAVTSNDTSGYSIYESLDATSTPTFYGVCVTIDHSGTPSPNTPNSTNGSGGPAVATFNASNQATACASGGTLLGPAPAAVTNSGAGGDFALLGSGTGAYVPSGTLPTTAIWTYSGIYNGGTVLNTGFFGEDVQLNVSANAASGTNQTHAIILYFVAN